MGTIQQKKPENGVATDPSDNFEIEDITEEDDIPVPYEYDISSYGADFPVESLVRRLKNDDILVPRFGQYRNDVDQISGFQRSYVWSRPKADRFIESLLLGLPVPGIFLAQDRANRFLVLDGQQRLLTLLYYYYGDETARKTIQLGNNVHPNYRGKGYEDLDDRDRRKLDDSIIHATVVKQINPKNDQSSIYDIFERLNTGGVNLQPQEIRIALYHGKLAKVLFEFNENPDWRFLYGRKSNRLKDVEMILRFFAFYYIGREYAKPMKSFLNQYMSSNRNLECQSKHDLKDVFYETTSFLKENLGNEAFRPKGALNAAALDSVMTGVAKRIQRGPVRNLSEVKTRLRDLFSKEEYIEAVMTGTSAENKVRTRLELASKAFTDIE